MKKDLLLLHGALGSKQQFAELKKQLSADYNLHDLNFEGHGGTDTDRDFSMALFTANALAYLDEQNLNQVAVFGYSMGGYVALNMALKHPERISQVVTLGTKFDWTPESASREVKMLNPEVIEAKVPHFAQKLAQEHHPADWKVVMQQTASMMLALGDGAGLSSGDLARIQHPVVIGIGEKDKMVSLEESQTAASGLSNGRLVHLEGVPHPIDRVDVTQLAAYIRAGLAADN